jgi:hypothetical protein
LFASVQKIAGSESKCKRAHCRQLLECSGTALGLHADYGARADLFSALRWSGRNRQAPSGQAEQHHPIGVDPRLVAERCHRANHAFGERLREHAEVAVGAGAGKTFGKRPFGSAETAASHAMTAEKVGPMPFTSNSWTRFFSVSLNVAGLLSRSCSIAAICCWTSFPQKNSRDRAPGPMTTRGDKAEVLQELRVQLLNGLDCTKETPTSVPTTPGHCSPSFHPPQVGNAGGQLLSKSWGQGPSLSGHQLVDLERLVARLHVDAANALGKQQSFYAVDVRRPLVD